MKTGKFVWYNGDWVPIDTSRPRPKPAGPIIISDSLPDVRNPVNGRRYDSKSRYYRDIAAAGCHISEQRKFEPHKRETRTPGNLGTDIKKSIEQLKSGTAPRH